MPSRDTKKTSSRWARLAVGYYRDPKLIDAGPIAELAFIRLLALAREMVETANKNGEVPMSLALRELREVTDLFTSLNPGSGPDELMQILQDNRLIAVEDKAIVVLGYESWQTTKDEINELREANRRRVAQHRAKKNQSDDDQEDEMLYENSVGAFEDLRESGGIKAGKQKVGKHGLPPNMVKDAEIIVEHLTEQRKKVLGSNFRVTNTWWSDTKKLLAGSGDSTGFTASQVCDLIDYALSNKFWHAHCQTPGGLAKHATKLWASDEFIEWSLGMNRPAENRPRNELIGKKTPGKGALKADNKVDWGTVGDKL
jgi:hypothetical protein